MLQSIRLQTSPGKVEAAIMHVIHMDSIIVEERRLTSMLQRNPLHTFMFARDGKLVVANKAAMEACQHSISGGYTAGHLPDSLGNMRHKIPQLHLTHCEGVLYTI